MIDNETREHIHQTRTDVAVIHSRLEEILGKVGEIANLRGRVETLEKSRIRDAAYAAGFGTGIGGTAVGILVKLLTVVALAVALSGCAPHGAPPGTKYRWLDVYRPVNVESRLTSEDCQMALDEALLFWRSAGVDYLRRRPGGWLSTIEVREGALESGTLGETHARHDLVSIVHADIILTDCNPLVVAHEIGHALGLGHNRRRGRLMYFAIGGAAWVLDDDEIEWVL